MAARAEGTEKANLARLLGCSNEGGREEREGGAKK
jgi:hypothetical protein